MGILDRYLLRELLVPLVYCLGGFLVFWLSSDLVNELDMLQRHHLRLGDIAEYYLVRLPEFLVVVVPVALLLALLYALTNLARHHEIIAMRAAGVSLWRLGVPYLLVGLILSLALFYLNETWVPRTSEAAEAILVRYERKPAHPAELTGGQPLNFRNDWDHRLWTIAYYHPDTRQMFRPKVDWQPGDGTRVQLLAERALWTNGAWTFYNVVEYRFAPGPDQPPTQRQTNELVMTAFTETPELIKSEIKISNLNQVQAAKRPQLSIREIQNYLRLHRQLTPLDDAKLKTQLHGRLAEPWMPLVVALIALPFGAVSSRRNVLVGVATSIFFCFAYFVLLRTGLALGTGGYLPPWLAAWSPNFLFGALGLGLTLRVA